MGPFEQIAERLILEAIENAASNLVGSAVRWNRSDDGIAKLVYNRAVEIMNTDPEINAKIKSEIISGIESWSPNRKR